MVMGWGASIRPLFICANAAHNAPFVDPRTAARLAWSLWLLALVLAASHLVLVSVGGLPQESEVLGLGGVFLPTLYSVTVVLLATMGALIASRRPNNAIGWLCCAWGVAFGLEMVGSEYASSTALVVMGSPPLGAVWVAWLSEMLNVHIVLIVPVLLLFPDGRVPGRAWRPVLWLAGACAALAEIFLAIKPGPLASASTFANPLGIHGADVTFAVPFRLVIVGTVAAALLAAAALALRLRRARGDERQQLKWIAYAGTLLALAFLVGFSSPPAWTGVVQTLFFIVLDAFLLTLGLAVLKYRLYDLDLIINRTLVYGALAVLITALYVAVVVGVGTVVGTHGEPNLGLSLIATALVAVAFQPLRERFQRVANRLVYGHRASPYEVLAEFSRRMAEALSVDEVVPHMAEAAARGVGAVRGRVRVYVPGGMDQAVAWPAEAVAQSFDRTVPVLHHGELLGEIAVAKSAGEAITGAEEKLLMDLASQAGPALKNVRLDLELRASRQRIVAAQDAERRRLERDIHDGAQQQLVAIAVTVRVAQELMRTDPAQAEDLLEQVGVQATEALDTMRELARGIFPAVLADRGLAAALEAVIGRGKGSARVALQTDTHMATARFPPGAEAAAYFCCLEALQNCAKYAAQSPATLQLEATDTWLTFTVVDTGPGFDFSQAHTGSGLRGMADRLAALGGTLEIHSQPGRGTTVRGRLPLAPVNADPARIASLDPAESANHSRRQAAQETLDIVDDRVDGRHHHQRQHRAGQ